MEPLVLFGAGLVIYCGYLALMDEIQTFRRCFTRSGVKCRRKGIGNVKSTTRKLADQRRDHAGNRAYARGRLLLTQVR